MKTKEQLQKSAYECAGYRIDAITWFFKHVFKWILVVFAIQIINVVLVERIKDTQLKTCIKYKNAYFNELHGATREMPKKKGK